MVSNYSALRNLHNKNSSFRQLMFDVIQVSMEEIVDGAPNDKYFENFERTPEFFSSLEPNTPLYGCIIPGINDDNICNKTSLYSLLKAGQIVPHTKGSGYKGHYCRSAAQSIVENLLYFNRPF